MTRLIRVAYGPFELGALREGETKEVRPSALRDALGTAYLELGGA